jgi:hypothetical protein
MLGLQNQQTEFLFDIADLNEIQPHRMLRGGEETITTPLGTYTATLVQEPATRTDSSRFSLWCARELDYFPVLIRKIEPDGTHWDLSLRKFTTPPHSPQTH